MPKGNKEIVLKMDSKDLFLTKEDFVKHSNLTEGTLNARISRNKLLRIRNGNFVYVLNPMADFDAIWDALPALLTFKEVCNFFCTDNISAKMMNEIGFYRIAGEIGAFTDKKSLCDYLMRQV